MQTQVSSFSSVIVRTIPFKHKKHILNDFKDFKIHRILSFGFFSNCFMDVNESDVPALKRMFPISNEHGVHLEFVPRHIANILKSDFVFKRQYDLKKILPNVEYNLIEKYGESKMFIRLLNPQDCSEVLLLNKIIDLPVCSYVAPISMKYFEHRNCGPYNNDIFLLQSHNKENSLKMNREAMTKLKETLNVTIVRRLNSGNIIVKPNSEQHLFNIFQNKPNDPKFPFTLCLLENKKFSKQETIFNYSNSYIYDLSRSSELTNEEALQKMIEPNKVSNFECLQVPDKLNMVKFDCEPVENYFRMCNNASIYPNGIPKRNFLDENVIKIGKMPEVSREFYKFLEDKKLVWKISESKDNFFVYVRSIEDYYNFFEKYAIYQPYTTLSRKYTWFQKVMGPLMGKFVYPWVDKTSLKIKCKSHAMENVKEMLKGFSCSLVYTPEEVEIDGIISTDKDKTITTYVKTNQEEGEHLMFMNGKLDGVEIKCHSLISSATENRIPILNEMVIHGISENISLFNIKKWLQDVEYNKIVRNGNEVNIFVTSESEIDKLLRFNHTLFDNKLITIEQATVEVEDKITPFLFYCFTKDTSKSSLDNLQDWMYPSSITEYAVSKEFDNCLIVKTNIGYQKELLFKSGSINHDGEDIFLRFVDSKILEEYEFLKYDDLFSRNEQELFSDMVSPILNQTEEMNNNNDINISDPYII